ncbi:MAG: hypothetical protein CM15mP29_1730 [Alphaproteobacteria bacterium]|nr:MAG: hypothetical protein CM15mP29_1730 [Alphaproteobacteria bacterium]
MDNFGIRLGTPACTTRGFGIKEFTLIGELITKVINGLSKTHQIILRLRKSKKRDY